MTTPTTTHKRLEATRELVAPLDGKTATIGGREYAIVFAEGMLTLKGKRDSLYVLMPCLCMDGAEQQFFGWNVNRPNIAFNGRRFVVRGEELVTV